MCFRRRAGLSCDGRSRRHARRSSALGDEAVRVVRGLALLLVLSGSLTLASDAAGGARDRPARASAQVAGVQVALSAQRLYHGAIDGIPGPSTRGALRALQRAHGLRMTGVADARTRAWLGRLGHPRYGSRPLTLGLVGLDVSALQFELRSHGFSTRVRGSFDRRTRGALIAFQRSAALRADGIAGPATYRALDAPRAERLQKLPRLRPPLAFATRKVIADGGVELFCPYATPVAAVSAGTVVFAGNRGSGYGYTVVTRDARRLTILYAHLSRIDVHAKQRLIAGAMVGLAGWTGKPDQRTSVRLELSMRGVRAAARAVLRALR